MPDENVLAEFRHGEEVVPKKSKATKLIELAGSVCSELFHTPDRRAYALIQRNEHQEVLAVKSADFRDWLAKQFYDASGEAPSSEALRQSINVLHAEARFDGNEHNVYTRVASLGEDVYLDLGDPAWRCIEIRADGWEVIPHPGPVRFRRASSMLPLPDPKHGRKAGRLWGFVNLADKDRLLFAAWVLHALRGRGPYPILILNGEQGSAKTSLAYIAKALLDPSKAPTRGAPRNERDLMIAAANSHVTVFDNLSHIQADLADSICRLATGGGLSTRQLFTDEDEIVFESTRPIILTGIEALAVRGDLADRAVVLTLPPLEQKKSEAEFKSQFEDARPYLLGALLDVLCEALRNVRAVRLKQTPRMVDFARLGVAAEKVLGFNYGDFMNAYVENRQDAGETLLEASPVAIRLRQFMVDRGEWIGTASELLDALNGLASDGDRRRRSWPSTPNALGGVLTRLAPSLRQVGIQIDRKREGHDRRRVITICKIGEAPRKVGKSSSASSADPYTAHPETVDSLGVTDSDPVADKADNADNENPTLEGVEVKKKEWEA